MASLIPYDRPLVPFRHWPFDGIDRFFDAPPEPLSPASGFKMNVEDADDSYIVTAELPGVTREEIDVELNEGRLSISVEKKETEEEKGKNYLHKETYEWSATRGVYLKDADIQGLAAKLTDGILTISVPKQNHKANATKIAID